MTWQLLVNGAVSASMYVLTGVGFAAIYSALRFFHFAHAAVVMTGAYVAFALFQPLGFPIWAAVAGGIVVSACIGCGMELVVYRPLRSKGAPSLVLLLASLGMYVVLQNVISMVFGDDAKSIRITEVKEGLNLLGARITPIQIVSIATGTVALIGTGTLLRFTRQGKAMKAMASDCELSVASGIDTTRVALFAFAVGSALAGVSGILIGIDAAVTPMMGMNVLLMGVIAVIVGGVRSIIGIAAAAVVLGMAQQFGAWYMGPEWQEAAAFAVLLVFLLFFPRGFSRIKEGKATV